MKKFLAIFAAVAVLSGMSVGVVRAGTLDFCTNSKGVTVALTYDQTVSGNTMTRKYYTSYHQPNQKLQGTKSWVNNVLTVNTLGMTCVMDP